MKNKNPCVYCGTLDGKMQRDHLPPQSFWNDAVEGRRITVPSCKKCHMSFSKDEGYFQSRILFNSANGNSEDATKNFKKFISNLNHNKKKKFKRSILSDCARREVLSKGGLFLGTASSIKTDHVIMKRFMKRLMQGCYFYFTKKLLLNFDMSVLYFDAIPMDNYNNIIMDDFYKNVDWQVIKNMINSKHDYIHSNTKIFNCTFKDVENKGFYAFFEFYNTVSMLVIGRFK